MRELARVVRIDNITPIDGADSIEAARVGGWTVVVKKGEFSIGDRAIYIEIDSFLRSGHKAWQFLVDKSSRVYDGITGHVLRTVRFRGQISQGLLLQLNSVLTDSDNFKDGENVTDVLGVLKYEPPIPAELAGEVLGLYPSRVPKTDQERIQNLEHELEDWIAKSLSWEVTEKLEGSSSTWAWLDKELHVCSRNMDLRETTGNTHWRLARGCNIEELLRSYAGSRNLALQGELVGNGVQGNIYRMQGHRFYLYDVYDVDRGLYMCSSERQEVARVLNLSHVPVLNQAFTFEHKESAVDVTKRLLCMADGESTLRKGQLREGLVFKALEYPCSFKVISNKYLMC